jgi:cytochrome b
MGEQRVFVWDLPTRLFHWLLAAAVTGAVVTGLQGGALMDWHGRFGLSIVGLLAFRLVWGFVGSTYARFIQFFPTPGKVAAYWRGQWRAEGHNPLGALSVFGLLALLAVQVASGLVGNDDIVFSGPLADLVTKDISNRLTGFHQLLSNALYALVALHVAAVLFYTRRKKRSLIKPMITGWKDNAQGESARGGGMRGLCCGAGCGGVGRLWCQRRLDARTAAGAEGGRDAEFLTIDRLLSTPENGSRADAAPRGPHESGAAWALAGQLRCRPATLRPIRFLSVFVETPPIQFLTPSNPAEWDATRLIFQGVRTIPGCGSLLSELRGGAGRPAGGLRRAARRVAVSPWRTGRLPAAARYARWTTSTTPMRAK